MNNAEVANVLEQTALLLEYKSKSFSYLVNDLLNISELTNRLEVPLELFYNEPNSTVNRHELERLTQYWFNTYSPEATRIFQEVVLTHSSRLLEQLRQELSPSVIELLQIRSLNVFLIDILRERLSIKSISDLKRACIERFLSQSGNCSEDEELNILEDILFLEETAFRKKNVGNVSIEPTDAEVIYSIETKTPRTTDPNTIFWANANALADYIIEELSRLYRRSVKQPTVNNVVFSETFDSVKKQTLGLLGKIKLLFFSYNNKQNVIYNEEAPRFFSQQSISSNIETNLYSDDLPFTIEKVGSIRRGQDAVNRLDFLIKSNNNVEIFECIKNASFVKEILYEGTRLISVRLQTTSFVLPFNNRPTPELELNFYIISEFIYGTYRVLLTSSPQHWRELQKRASQKGYNLTTLGLYKGVRRISSRTENKLYHLLDLPIIPEELREGVSEWDWIKSGTPDLISITDIKGDMHMHSTFTDGSGSVEEMAIAARGLGLSYIALTDHTQNVCTVGGMNDIEFLRYWDYIDEFNDKLRREGILFRVLKGVEVDILENGGLDLTDETLSHADWVIASIHFGKRQARSRIHARYMDAFKNPYVDVIAHPTGRMIGIEDEIDVDIDFLCENARKYQKCLELNSQPRRLDLKLDYLRIAQKAEIPIVISTDSHSPEQLSYLQYGVQQAFRAGLTRWDVLNTLSAEQLLERRRQMRESANY